MKYTVMFFLHNHDNLLSLNSYFNAKICKGSDATPAPPSLPLTDIAFRGLLYKMLQIDL